MRKKIILIFIVGLFLLTGLTINSTAIVISNKEIENIDIQDTENNMLKTLNATIIVHGVVKNGLAPVVGARVSISPYNGDYTGLSGHYSFDIYEWTPFTVTVESSKGTLSKTVQYKDVQWIEGLGNVKVNFNYNPESENKFVFLPLIHNLLNLIKV